MGFWTRFEPLPKFPIHLAATRRGLYRLSLAVSSKTFARELAADSGEMEWKREDHSLLQEATRQLTRYFRGNLREFRLPLDLRGTAFQKRVWKALLRIPYGETRSYADVAKAIGSPKAVRAVGGANGANPVAIIVPCHRVIASDGTLGGFGSGLDCKRKLLTLEGGAV
jgi:O-6-methylguanine DNA methyltransferase